MQAGFVSGRFTPVDSSSKRPQIPPGQRKGLTKLLRSLRLRNHTQRRPDQTGLLNVCICRCVTGSAAALVVFTSLAFNSCDGTSPILTLPVTLVPLSVLSNTGAITTPKLGMNTYSTNLAFGRKAKYWAIERGSGLRRPVDGIAFNVMPCRLRPTARIPPC